MNHAKRIEKVFKEEPSKIDYLLDSISSFYTFSFTMAHSFKTYSEYVFIHKNAKKNYTSYPDYIL